MDDEFGPVLGVDARWLLEQEKKRRKLESSPQLGGGERMLHKPMWPAPLTQVGATLDLGPQPQYASIGSPLTA
jgi:hypothetical protein